MKQPNWDEAPEWANVLLEQRYNRDRTAWAGAYKDGANASWTRGGMENFMLDSSCWEVVSTRPTQWRGPQDGLPPVGLTVLNRFDEERLVVAHDGDTVVCRTPGGHYRGYTKSEQAELRPIQTHEQIAAREREEAIEAMHAIYMRGALGHKGGLAALYDAGYRKPDQR